MFGKLGGAFYVLALVVGLWTASHLVFVPPAPSSDPRTGLPTYLRVAAWDWTGSDITMADLADLYGLGSVPIV